MRLHSDEQWSNWEVEVTPPTQSYMSRGAHKLASLFGLIFRRSTCQHPLLAGALGEKSACKCLSSHCYGSILKEGNRHRYTVTTCLPYWLGTKSDSIPVQLWHSLLFLQNFVPPECYPIIHPLKQGLLLRDMISPILALIEVRLRQMMTYFDICRQNSRGPFKLCHHCSGGGCHTTAYSDGTQRQ